MVRHLTSISDLSSEEILDVTRYAHGLKDLADQDRRPTDKFMDGRHAMLLFEKPSNRTRSSLHTAILDHGGHPDYRRGDEVLTRPDGLERESLEDVVHVMERMYRFIIARVMSHQTIERMAKSVSQASVVNALCDKHHPLQALADIATVERRFGTLKDKKVSFVGDWNNVSTSLAQACAKVGVDFSYGGPRDPRNMSEEWEKALRFASESGAALSFTPRPEEAVEGAHAVYADTFVSMGDEANRERLLGELGHCKVTPKLMEHADKDAVFLHCLPAHRGEEVEPQVIDGPQSLIFDLAEYRKHTAAGVLKLLLESR
jgi:ornithine carbamoyltransferase